MTMKNKLAAAIRGSLTPWTFQHTHLCWRSSAGTRALSAILLDARVKTTLCHYALNTNGIGSLESPCNVHFFSSVMVKKLSLFMPTVSKMGVRRAFSKSERREISSQCWPRLQLATTAAMCLSYLFG